MRLLKPLDYYQKKYGTWQYGLQRLFLLMEKQHNRGQDGAGAVGLKLDQPTGEQYIYRLRSNGDSPIQDIIAVIHALQREDPLHICHIDIHLHGTMSLCGLTRM